MEHCLGAGILGVRSRIGAGGERRQQGPHLNWGASIPFFKNQRKTVTPSPPRPLQA